MSDEEKLRVAAAEVDVVDLAGAIVANPVRGTIACTQAGTLALALAFELAWAISLEADVLVRALKLPITGNDEQDDVRDHAIQSQIDAVEHLLAPIRKPRTTS
jgi:hypothetical protein